LNLRSYQARAEFSAPDSAEGLGPGSTIPSKLPPFPPPGRARARYARVMIGREVSCRLMTVAGMPSVVSCWRMASTAGVPSVTTSTLRSTPPWGPTGGAVGAALNGAAT
jgi:hypothetical protein